MPLHLLTISEILPQHDPEHDPAPADLRRVLGYFKSCADQLLEELSEKSQAWEDEAETRQAAHQEHLKEVETSNQRQQEEWKHALRAAPESFLSPSEQLSEQLAKSLHQEREDLLNAAEANFGREANSQALFEFWIREIWHEALEQTRFTLPVGSFASRKEEGVQTPLDLLSDLLQASFARVIQRYGTKSWRFSKKRQITLREEERLTVLSDTPAALLQNIWTALEQVGLDLPAGEGINYRELIDTIIDTIEQYFQRDQETLRCAEDFDALPQESYAHLRSFEMEPFSVDIGNREEVEQALDRLISSLINLPQPAGEKPKDPEKNPYLLPKPEALELPDLSALDQLRQQLRELIAKRLVETKAPSILALSARLLPREEQTEIEKYAEEYTGTPKTHQLFRKHRHQKEHERLKNQEIPAEISAFYELLELTLEIYQAGYRLRDIAATDDQREQGKIRMALAQVFLAKLKEAAVELELQLGSNRVQESTDLPFLRKVFLLLANPGRVENTLSLAQQEWLKEKERQEKREERRRERA